MENMTKLLEQLASQLGTTVEYLWGVLLQQVNVEIILCNMWMGIWMWGGIIIIAISIIGLIISFKTDEEMLVVWSFVFIILAVFFGTIGYYENYSEWLTLTNNPEYWALQEILTSIAK